MNYQRFQIVRSGITRSMGGFVVPAFVPTLRALVLNGTNQDARVDLPNASPWNSMAAFQIGLRVRGLTDDATRRVMNLLGPTYDINLSIASGSGRIDFSEGRDGISIFHSPTALNDLVIRLQFDPANTLGLGAASWTYESWKADGTGRVQGTSALTTTTNLNVSDTVYWGSNGGAGSFANGHYDWMYVQSGVTALNTFPGAEPSAGTYYALWKFDANDGTDWSGNGLTLTLTNSPSFENTP